MILNYFSKDLQDNRIEQAVKRKSIKYNLPFTKMMILFSKSIRIIKIKILNNHIPDRETIETLILKHSQLLLLRWSKKKIPKLHLSKAKNRSLTVKGKYYNIMIFMSNRMINLMSQIENIDN